MHDIAYVQIENPIILILDSKYSFDIILKGSKVVVIRFSIDTTSVVVGGFIELLHGFLLFL